MFQLRKKSKAVNQRDGVAAVEAAILLPLLVLLTFGSLELSNMIFLKQGLSIATYEGAKTATTPGTTSAQVTARIQEILSSRNITDATISITPQVEGSTARGTMVTVSITSEGNSVGILTTRLFTRGAIQAQSTMVRQ